MNKSREREKQKKCTCYLFSLIYMKNFQHMWNILKWATHILISKKPNIKMLTQNLTTHSFYLTNKPCAHQSLFIPLNKKNAKEEFPEMVMMSKWTYTLTSERVQHMENVSVSEINLCQINVLNVFVPVLMTLDFHLGLELCFIVVLSYNIFFSGTNNVP